MDRPKSGPAKPTLDPMLDDSVVIARRFVDESRGCARSALANGDLFWDGTLHGYFVLRTLGR